MNRKIEKLVRCLAFAWLLTSPVLPTFGQFKTYDKVFEFDSLGYAKVVTITTKRNNWLESLTNLVVKLCR